MATVFLDPNDVFTVSNNNTTIKGSTGNEVLTLAAGVTGLRGDQNIERIVFNGDSSAFTYQQTGNSINVFSGGVLVYKTSVQGDADGTQLTFFNGTVDVKLTSGVMTLGGSTVSSTAPGSVTPINIDGTLFTPGGSGGGTAGDTLVTVTAAGSSDANAPVGKHIYTVNMGTYTYDIANFAAGDVIDFPTGNTPSVINDSFTDGIVDLTFALSGQTVTIHLTGIPVASDQQLFSSADFNTVFGSGSLI